MTDTWTLYDGLADRYDTVIPFFGAFASRLVDLLDPAPGTRVLDIGTGRGAIAKAAADRGCAVIAVDPAARMVALLAAERPDIDARVGDARALDLPDGSVDLVTGGFMIHVVDGADRVLAEAHRVLRPGGMVALTVPGGGAAGDDRWARYHAIVGEYVSKAADPTLPEPVDEPALLAAAGFTDLAEHTIEVHLAIPDAHTYWDFMMSHGFAGFVAALPPADAVELRDRVLAELSTMDEIVVDRGALTYLARR